MGRKSTLALTRTKGTEAAAASQCSEAGLAASRDDGHLSRAFARGAMVFQFMRASRGDSGESHSVITSPFMGESRHAFDSFCFPFMDTQLDTSLLSNQPVDSHLLLDQSARLCLL